MRLRNWEEKAKDALRRTLVALALVLVPTIAHAGRHVLNGQGCDHGSEDLRDHLCRVHRLCAPSPGEPGYAFGSIAVFRTFDDCEKVKRGYLDACGSVKASCNVPSCTPVAASSNTTSGYDAREMKYAERAIEEYVQTGNVNEWTGGMAGFEIGAAFHETLKRNAQNAAEKKRLEELRRAEEERQRRIREEREREERIARLAPYMKMSTESNVDLKLESEVHSLGMKFDGSDSSLEYRSNAEFVARDDSTDFFSNCGRYDVPVTQWVVPYQTVQHLRHGVLFVRRALPTTYARADIPAIVDEGLSIAQGCRPKTVMPDEDFDLPANAAELMREAAVRHKLATDERIAATAAVDESMSRRDLARAARAALQQEPPPGATQADRKALIAGVDRMLKAFDVEVNQRTKELSSAKLREAQALDRERGHLQTFAVRCHSGPVEYCEDRDAQITAVRTQGGIRQKVIAASEARLREARGEAAKHHARNTKLLREGPAREIAKQIEEASKRYLSQVKAIQLADTGGIPADVKLRLASAAVLINEVNDAVAKFRKYSEAVVDFKTDVHEKNLRDSWDALLAAMERLDQAEWFSDLAQLGLKVYARRLGGGDELLADLIADALSTAYRIVELSVRMNIEVASAVAWRWSAEEERELLDRMKEADRWMSSVVDERAARVAEIRRGGGCISTQKCADTKRVPGMNDSDVKALREYAASTKRTLVLRAPKEGAARHHGEPGYRPKPAWVHEKTAANGLVYWGARATDFPEGCAGRCDVDASGFLRIDGDRVYSDYDLQGVFEATKGATGKRERVDTNDAEERSALNEVVSPCAQQEQQLFQHGANDDFLEDGLPQRCPDADERFVVFEPSCSVAEIGGGLLGLKSHYLKHNLPWVYSCCEARPPKSPCDGSRASSPFH